MIGASFELPPALRRVSFKASSRRPFARQVNSTAALFSVPGRFAEEMARKTPWVEEGVFYPPKLPLDNDHGKSGPHSLDHETRKLS